MRDTLWNLFRSILPALSGLALLGLTGCASWQAPALPDENILRERAVSETSNGVTVRGTVLSVDDNTRYFGKNLNEQDIQTVWIEVVNDSSHTLWLLTSGTDPDYFSPLEVAWPFHRKFSDKSNDRIDQHFDDLGFKSPIPPGATRSGFLYTNPHHKTRVLNIDLLGQQTLYPFTLFPQVPGELDVEHMSRLYAILEQARQHNIEDEDSLRDRLEQLPCCASSGSEGPQGDPINLVMIGDLHDIASAVVRRGYRHDLLLTDRLQLYNGRLPDLVMRKSGQGGSTANWIRAWLAPFTYQDQPVLIGQVGRPIGGRYLDSETADLVLHPDIDETRNLTITDMMYSGGLSKLGFVAGIPPVTSAYLREHNDTLAYYTDGLRAVVFVITRPLSLSDVDILDWVPLLNRREEAARQQLFREKGDEQGAD